MRVVVTGAAGFIGSHTAEALLTGGHEVVGIDNFNDYYDPRIKRRNLATLESAGIHAFYEEDTASETIAACLDGADAIIHLAALGGVRASWGSAFRRYAQSNIVGTQRLLEWAGTARPRFIFVSSSSVYGSADEGAFREDQALTPGSPYGVSKIAGEQLALLYGREYDFPVVVLRPFSVYGPRERPDKAIQAFLTAARGDRKIQVHGDGSQERDFTYVGDVVDGLVRAMTKPPAGEILNLCRGRTVALTKILDIIQDVTGVSLDITYGRQEAGDVKITHGDDQKAKALLGFEATTDLVTGIERQWAAVQSE